MVNVPGKSRGCATCRRRRVKCDLSLPECMRCVRLGQPCPGAITDVFFVHAAPRSSTSMLQQSPCSRQLVAAWQLPSSEPSRGDVFDQLFVSHFIDSFFGSSKPPPISGPPPKTWLHELPGFVASPDHSLVKHSIRAASMFSYGVSVDDTSIKMEACRWYMVSLQNMRYLLSRVNKSFHESVVCAVVMLIHFETLSGTSRKAWMQHVKGLTMMLVTEGPSRCRRGFLHQLFSHVRLQAFAAAMAENTVHTFALNEWMTIPFELHPKHLFDGLVDVLFSVQKCLGSAHRLLYSLDSSSGAGVKLEAWVSTLITDTMSKLNLWRLDYLQHTGFRDTTTGVSLDSASAAIPATSIPEAALLSLYDSASILVLRLLLLVSPSGISFTHRVLEHACSILACNSLIEAMSGPRPDRGSIMMVLQLKVVSLWSPSCEQRAAACNVLNQDRVQDGGFADISQISQEFFAEVATHILHHYPTE